MRLLTLNVELIQGEINRMRSESKAIKKTIAELCIYMKGGITWDEAWRLSPDMRTLLYTSLKSYYEKSSNHLSM